MRKYFNNIAVAFLLVVSSQVQGSLFLESWDGSEECQDPLTIELITSPILQRLKLVNQHGIVFYTCQTPGFSRYDHSIGVYLLLKKYGASYKEQIAGLLHDTSHTIFSHVGDHLFKHITPNSSYQDDILHWYLEKQGAGDILKKYGLELIDIVKDVHHDALEQDLPDMCADRIDYNLRTAFVYGFLDEQGIHEILENLHFKDHHWFFEDPAIARQFASFSLYFTEHLWGAAWNQIAYHFCAEALSHALSEGIITFDDIHFSTDEIVLEKLDTSRNEKVLGCLEKCRHAKENVTPCIEEEADMHIYPKFRGIDPLIQINGKYVRLTELDETFAKETERVKKLMQQGFHLKIASNAEVSR